MSFRGMLHVFYIVGFTFVLVVALVGIPYYSLPISERPHSEMHTDFKPGGIWGHGLGIFGSAMVLLLLLYSVRKRQRFGIRFGPLSRWLDIHIWLGIIGPLLITLHTAMKFKGIVSISYYSMVIVAVSGVFGRYVYMQIPRDGSGVMLGIDASRQRVARLQESLASRLPPDAMEGIARFVAVTRGYDASGARALFATLLDDIRMPWRARRLEKFLRAGSRDIPRDEIREIVNLAKKQSVLVRRLAALDAMTRTLHYWHVFHKPFAYIMITIMFVHVAVVVLLGYKWVF